MLKVFFCDNSGGLKKEPTMKIFKFNEMRKKPLKYPKILFSFFCFHASKFLCISDALLGWNEIKIN